MVNETQNNEAKAKLVDAFRDILEFTLRKCVANVEARKRKSIDGKQGQKTGEEVEVLDLNGEKVENAEKVESEIGEDEYDELTLLGANFVRKLRASEDGRRAYDLLVQLVNPTEDNGEFVNLLIVKLHTILGKVVRSTLLPISNQMVISSRQQHNVFNSDSRERRFVCPMCGLRFLTPVTRNKHLRAHTEVNVNVCDLTDEVITPASICVPNSEACDRSVTSEVSEITLDSRSGTPESSKTHLNKASVLHELKIRMLDKMEKTLKAKLQLKGMMNKPIDQAAMDLADEEDMLAIEEECLKEQEEYLEEHYLSLLKKNNAVTQSGQSTLQQVIREIQSSIISTPTQKPVYKPPTKPFIKMNNNFKCLQCDRIFIREDEVYHHNRLEHADKTLASKLDDIRKKTPAGNDALLSSTGISPIKPVEIITAPVTMATQRSPLLEESDKQLAPLLTRKELQQKVPVEVEKRSRGAGSQTDDTDTVVDDDGNVSKIVKVGTKELVLQRTAKGSLVAASPRRIIKDDQGRIDRVVQRDSTCLIEFDKALPVKIINLSNNPAVGTATTAKPTAPLLRTPIASQLVSKLRLEINRKMASQSPTHSPSVGTPRESSESQESPGQLTLGTLNQATKLKRGPRIEEIPHEVRLSALAQLRALSGTDNRKKKRKKPEAEEEDSEEEEEMEEVCEDGGVLLTNSSNWKRVAEVEKDWETSDEEEEEEVITTRITRGKRKS